MSLWGSEGRLLVEIERDIASILMDGSVKGILDSGEI